MHGHDFLCPCICIAWGTPQSGLSCGTLHGRSGGAALGRAGGQQRGVMGQELAVPSPHPRFLPSLSPPTAQSGSTDGPGLEQVLQQITAAVFNF